jgi:hypothetical protein
VRRRAGIVRKGGSNVSRLISRRACLTLLAVGNLALWLAMAAVVGVLASDGVNLGLETFIRERQATVVAYMQALSSARPWAAPRPANPAAAQMPVAGGASRTGPELVPDGSTLLPPPVVATAAGSEAGAPAGQALAPQSSPPMIGSPLQLSDPMLSDLMQLDAEMSRSIVGRPVQIRYQEAALNREIAAWLAQSPDLAYRNVTVSLKQDRVVVTGDVFVLGFGVGAEVLGLVVADNCLPRAEVQAVSVGGLLTPRSVKNRVAETIMEAFNWYPSNSALCLERIVVEDGVVTVYGVRR